MSIARDCTGARTKDDKKVASIGVRVSRQITYHGMAINISNDLRIFDFLVPCGLQGVEMTSVETGGRLEPVRSGVLMFA